MVFFIMAGSRFSLSGGANGFESVVESALSKIKNGKFAPGKIEGFCNHGFLDVTKVLTSQTCETNSAKLINLGNQLNPLRI